MTETSFLSADPMVGTTRSQDRFCHQIGEYMLQDHLYMKLLLRQRQTIAANKILGGVMAQKIDLDSECLLLGGQTSMLQCVTLPGFGLICLTCCTREGNDTAMAEANNGIMPMVLHKGKNYGPL